MSLLTVEYASIIRVHNKVVLENNPDIEIKPITEENINDGATFNSEAEIQNFRKFLKAGHKGYYGYYKGNCGIRIWTCNTEERALVGKNFLYKLPKDEAFVVWGKTSEDFRLLGLYTYALQFLILDNKDKVISGYIDPSNYKSLKGLEKVGFLIVENYTLIKFWKFHLKIKTFQLGSNFYWPLSFGYKIKPLSK